MGGFQKKLQAFSIVFAGVFFFVGVAMGIGAIFALKHDSDFRARADRVDAEIVSIEAYRDRDGDTSYTVLVSYEYGGREYSDIALGFYSSSMYEGKVIGVLCDRENPAKVRPEEGAIAIPAVLGSMSGVFMLIGGVAGVVLIARMARVRRLMRKGRTVYAAVESFDIDPCFTVNGRNPYVLYCTYRAEDGVVYRFKSPYMWEDPALSYNIGDSIPVVVDGDNYAENYVDLDRGSGVKNMY